MRFSGLSFFSKPVGVEFHRSGSLTCHAAAAFRSSRSSPKPSLREPLRRLILIVTAFGLITISVLQHGTPASAKEEVPRFAGATSSQPLALTADGEFLLVANPDNNS